MKILHRAIQKDGRGQIKLLPQEPDDIWHLYHLLSIGDLLTASTFRKLTTTSSTGSTSSSKVRVRLTLLIETIEYDASTSMLRVKGTNREENEHVKMGQYHTMDLVLHNSFTLDKAAWDAIYLDRLDTAADTTKQADVAALLIQPGLANLCLLTQHLTVIKQRIELNIPKKRGGGSMSGHDSAMSKFFQQCYEAITRHVDFATIKVFIIASPAFTRDDFYAYMQQESQRHNDRIMLDHRSKFVLTHSSSAHKHALTELLTSPQLVSRLDATKSMDEVKALADFQRLMMTEPDRAWYGYEAVKRAVDERAVSVLMVTDTLFKAMDVAERRRYVALVEEVKEAGGQVLILSGQHPAGEELKMLTGVAAILKWGMAEQHEEEEVDEYKEGEGEGGMAGGDEKKGGVDEGDESTRRKQQSYEENHDDLM